MHFLVLNYVTGIHLYLRDIFFFAKYIITKSFLNLFAKYFLHIVNLIIPRLVLNHRWSAHSPKSPVWCDKLLISLLYLLNFVCARWSPMSVRLSCSLIVNLFHVCFRSVSAFLHFMSMLLSLFQTCKISSPYVILVVN